MWVVLIGAPGAGKGTQARFIRDELRLPVLSTGNLLREAIMSGSPLGEYAQRIIDGGSLVPDEVVIGIVKETLEKEECKNGVIFDGFPRTVSQAIALDEMVKIDSVISIDVPDSVIIHRMEGRRTCPNCQRTYHLESNPPKIPGVCNSCGSILGIRNDDIPDVIRERLKIYHERTEPIKTYYGERGVLSVIEGLMSVEDTKKEVFKALGVSHD